MRVTFWGVRGSVPTPGPSTVRYGGNTSCVEVRLADGTTVILDGGTGIRNLGRKLVDEGSRGPFHLLVTHVHWDHIIGIPFFQPIYHPDTTLVLHPMVMETPSHVLSHDELFDGQHFPLRMHQLPSKMVRPQPVAPDVPWRIGSAQVKRIWLNHPGGSTGFRLDDEDGTSMVFLTDNELQPPGARNVTPIELAKFAEGATLMVHDAQYLEEDMPLKHGWGHSTVPQVLELGRSAGCQRLVLYHHEPERSDDALDAIAQGARDWWKANAKTGEVLVAREGLTL
jgi:phosphoribosyl 1,2-cyclic phosphodiesterase